MRLRQYTIELRIEIEDETVDKADLDAITKALASETTALARTFLDRANSVAPGSEAKIYAYSDDFFEGHTELTSASRS